MLYATEHPSHMMAHVVPIRIYIYISTHKHYTHYTLTLIILLLTLHIAHIDYYYIIYIIYIKPIIAHHIILYRPLVNRRTTG